MIGQVKRDNAGRLFVCLSVIQEIELSEVSTNKSGGFDFGFKTFLTMRGVSISRQRCTVLLGMRLLALTGLARYANIIKA